MNVKSSLLLPGAIALLLSTTSLLPVQAQSQNAPGPRMERMTNKLNLTEQQKSQLQKLREDTQSRIIREVLTADQRSRYEAALQQGEKPRKIMKSLNLTSQQRTQMRTIHQESRQRMEQILTPEQLNQMRQRQQNRPQRRQQGQPQV